MWGAGGGEALGGFPWVEMERKFVRECDLEEEKPSATGENFLTPSVVESSLGLVFVMIGTMLGDIAMAWRPRYAGAAMHSTLLASWCPSPPAPTPIVPVSFCVKDLGRVLDISRVRLRPSDFVAWSFHALRSNSSCFPSWRTLRT